VGPSNGVPLPNVTDEAHAVLANYSQGEIVEVRSLPVMCPWPPKVDRLSTLRIFTTWLRAAPPKVPPAYPAPDGSVVISQTCDIAQRDRLTVQLAPLVRLGGSDASEARINRRPRFIPLPNVDDHLFVDLQSIVTVHKNDLLDVAHKPGVNGAREGRKLAQAVGRRFTRFPFPDDLHPWLRPLEKVLQTKATKPSTPEGMALASVLELRVEAKGAWEDPPPYILTVLIIVEQGVLPYGRNDDEVPEEPASLTGLLRDDERLLKLTAGQIAAELKTARTAPERYYLWLALGEAWAAQCSVRPGEPDSVRAAVDSIDGEVVSADDLTMDRWWGSEALDLDHLSAPRPQ